MITFAYKMLTWDSFTSGQARQQGVDTQMSKQRISVEYQYVLRSDNG